tara:strand:+ start:171 stop:767 length:597 start_codon:yes stop_codon:yes gene_type:complete
MREKNSDYIYFQVRTVFVLLSFDKSPQRDTLYIQGKQFSRSNSEVFMTYSISPSFNYIRPITILNDGTLASLSQPKTSAKVPTWQVVTADRSRAVQCHNYQSALAIAEGRAPEKNERQDAEFTYRCQAFVSPSGQYYIEIAAGSQKVRLDVANAQTARHYVKNGVSTTITNDAYFDQYAHEQFQPRTSINLHRNWLNR